MLEIPQHSCVCVCVSQPVCVHVPACVCACTRGCLSLCACVHMCVRTHVLASVCGCVPALGMGWADAGLNSWHVACVVKLVDSIRCCFVRPHREGCELLASPRGSGVRWGVTHQVALHVRTCQPVLW